SHLRRCDDPTNAGRSYEAAFYYQLCVAAITVTFTYQSARDHRHLHSFPTRRSSDLQVPNEPRQIRQAALDALGRPTVHAVQNRRSEEHTSDLQSRSDLVCRLLLEKKKQLILKEPISVASGCGRLWKKSYSIIRRGS